MNNHIQPACRASGMRSLVALGVVLCAMAAGVAGQSTAASGPAQAPAQAASAGAASQPALPVPPTFNVEDLPSDDGSAVLVEWPRPAVQPRGAKYAYVVEVAKSPEDFKAGTFEKQVVTPSPLPAKPGTFWYTREAAENYFAEISPSDLFKPADLPAFTRQRLDKLAADGMIPMKDLPRAQAALAEQSKPMDQFTSAQRADRKWLGRLEAYLKKKDQEAQKDQTEKINAQTYYFRLAVMSADGHKTYVSSDGQPMMVPGQAKPNWFKVSWINNLIFSLAFCGIVIAFIQVAKRRPGMFIRKIAGLDAVDEAIGRATEMDRPVFFVHGLGGVGDMPTIAAINILGRVAGRAAEHDTRIRVMNVDPIVTAVSQEVVQQAYVQAGRPDAYNPDDVSLVASDQFSYVAAVSGNMVREQPGAIFMLGAFMAESLLLAETGASTGAIQVAGTDAYTQLPFFITTCDYTLIGEELYAASAYLSREPRLLGSLRGQDVGKAFLMIAIVGGCVALTVAAIFHQDWSWLRGLFSAAAG